MTRRDSKTPRVPRLCQQRLRAVPAFVCALLLAAPTRAADNPRALIARGHDAYAAGRYQEALDAYQKAGELDAHLRTPELLHNQAAAQFKLGKLEEARELWTRIKQATDAPFEARTRYNLANCDYAEALAAQQNPGQALKSLAKALQGYQDAVRLDPNLPDARANLELAQRLKTQLEEQQKNQQNDPNQPHDPNQPRDPNEHQDPNQPRDPNQHQDPNQPRDPNQSRDPNQQQDPNQPRDPNQSEPNEPQEPNDSPQQSREPNQPQAEPNQPPPQSASEPNEPNDPNALRPPPPRDANTPDANQPASPPPPDPNAPQLDLTRAEAERLLQKVREAEKRRRELLAQRRAARQEPVKRDW